MTRYRLAAVAAVLVAVGAATLAHAAGLFNGFPVGNGASYCSGYSAFPSGTTTPGTLPTPNQCNSTVPAGPALTGNEYYPADTAVPGATTQTQPPTVLVPGTALAGMTYATPRNLLGNGALLGTQVNGTATVTGATTSAPTTAAISADRWVLDTNVTSGAGRSAIVTSSPSPPTGFTQSMKVFRTSGALLQPICVWQAVPTPDSTQLAGQTVTFSASLAALAGLSADNGNLANLVIISGTGTDQGFNGSWTATPAITPAWTGITTVINTQINLTTAFARFSTSAVIPAAATEVGVGLCFTPTATGAGSTDGFAFTAAQLERSNVMSLFEVKPKARDVIDNQQFVYAITEGALGPSRSVCHFTTANSVMQCPIVFPVPMYKAPTVTYAVGFAGFTTTAETSANSCTGLAADATVALTVTTQQTMAQCTIAAGTTAAVGLSMTLVDNGGTGTIFAWTGL